MSSRCRTRSLGLLAGGLALLVAAGAAAAPVLKVCVEPDNLPFADAAGGGFEGALARLLARDLGAALELVPVAQGPHGFVRSTLGEGRCDALMGMPAGADAVLTTRPYYRSTWMFVARAGGPSLASFDDPAARSLRIGVPVVGEGWDTAPVAALGRRGVVDNLRRFPAARGEAAAAPVAAVARGEVDVAVVWGPFAGWHARRQPVALTLSPTPATDGGVPLTVPIAAAVRRGNAALRDALDAAIAREGAEIGAILAEWRVPLAAPDGGSR
jgi:mxaJ protein